MKQKPVSDQPSEFEIWIGANVSSVPFVPFDYDFSTPSQSNRNNQLKGKKIDEGNQN